MRHLGSAAAVVVVLAAAFVAAPALRADEVDDDIKAMKVADSSGKEDDAIAKIDSLRAGRDNRSFLAIRDLTTSAHDKVACAAIRGIVDTWHEPEFFRWLVGKISDKDLSDPKGAHREVYLCVLDAIGRYPPDKVKAALKPLADAVARYMTTDGDFADAAIRTYGKVPDRFTVMQLLDWLNQASAAGGPPAAKPHKEKAKKAALETLAALCGQSFESAADWKKWWDENGKTFKFPDAPTGAPAAPSAGGKPGAAPTASMPDPSGLAEFKDDTFGWSVKRPEGEDWKFFKPDYNVPRVGLRCGDDSEFRARAYFCVHDPSKYDPKTIKAFAEWVVENPFKEQLPTADRIALPETRTMMLNGTEWTVVSCKGLAAGPKANWGSMERRFYITKLGNYFLYVDAFTRLSADTEDKEGLWSCIESITLSPKK
jgi:hypothetical protein